VQGNWQAHEAGQEVTTQFEQPVIGIDPSAGTLAVVCLSGDFCVMDKIIMGRPFTTVIPERAYAAVSSFLSSVATGVTTPHVFMEAPLVAGRSRGISGTIKQAMVSGAVQVAVSEWGMQATLVYPSQWKKELGIGGNAKKEAIAAWLRANHPKLHAMCVEDQDLMDASCIGLYGELVLARAARMASPGKVSGFDAPVLHNTRVRRKVRRPEGM
jgi:hypothetical protein